MNNEKKESLSQFKIVINILEKNELMNDQVEKRKEKWKIMIIIININEFVVCKCYFIECMCVCYTCGNT